MGVWSDRTRRIITNYIFNMKAHYLAGKYYVRVGEDTGIGSSLLEAITNCMQIVL